MLVLHLQQQLQGALKPTQKIVWQGQPLAKHFPNRTFFAVQDAKQVKQLLDKLYRRFESGDQT